MRNILTTYLVAGLATLSFLPGCAGTVLLTRSADPADMGGGAFTLIVYGNEYGEDVRTAAVLDIEGDAYTIMPYGASFRYERTKGLSGVEAYKAAVRSVGNHRNFMTTETRRILASDGTVIGYEVRPLYMPESYGMTDILDISYVLEDGGLVRFYVDTKLRMNRLLDDNDRGFRL